MRRTPPSEQPTLPSIRRFIAMRVRCANAMPTLRRTRTLARAYLESGEVVLEQVP